MNIQTKFSLGDYVYPICQRRETIKIPTNCPICNDTGQVELNKNTYICPECRGFTYRTVDGDIEWYVTDNPGYIGRVSVLLYDEKYKKRNEDEINYMIDSTGVGSGTLWKEENLFLTTEEAINECEKRNKKEKLNV